MTRLLTKPCAPQIKRGSSHGYETAFPGNFDALSGENETHVRYSNPLQLVDVFAGPRAELPMT
jgi:hypothetical protein